MEDLPDFRLVRPTTVEQARTAHVGGTKSLLLGGGTDLIVNLRRGIGDAPEVLIDVSNVAEMRRIDVDERSFSIGASVRLQALAEHHLTGKRLPALARCAGSVAGPTHRYMGTVGGNLCLDTRCVFYNQSEWWRASNDYCLKHRGSICHVAPKSKVCYATFSGDLASVLLVLGAEVEIAGPGGLRRVPLSELYTGDGKDYLSLGRGEFLTRVAGCIDPTLRIAYEKFRIRRSIDFPLAGVAAGVRLEDGVLAGLRVAFVGTNPRPFLLEGVEALVGRALDERVLDEFDGLVRRQVMAMRTTFTSGHYRRRVAGVLGRRLLVQLIESG